ncbi:MAG: hypothetical protein JSS51_01410 [Planctomycetes bacterium]|nr:hypothetical protein [Planctomycetota bacterium]
MNQDAIKDTLSLIVRLYPNTNWPPELQKEFARRLKSIDITGAQAEAAIVSMRMSKPFQSVQPCDLLDAVSGAEAKGGTGSADDRSLPDDRAFLNRVLQSDREMYTRFASELHREMAIPPHYRDAPQSYAIWPKTCQRLAAKLRAAGVES